MRACMCVCMWYSPYIAITSALFNPHLDEQWRFCGSVCLLAIFIDLIQHLLLGKQPLQSTMTLQNLLEGRKACACVHMNMDAQ